MSPKITADELISLIMYIHEISGIALDESKDYLIESRLGPLVTELGCGSYYMLCQKARSNEQVRNRMIDAISTRETSFFRDLSPFDLLKDKILPDHIKRQTQALSIWSAASSTGQEIYSVAMILKEVLHNLEDWRLRILGTDISEAALAQAQMGRYNQIESQRGLPIEKRDTYFHKQGTMWCVQDCLRKMVSFQFFNLLNDFSSLGQFDVILCRNVAIYFDIETRKNLFDRLANQLTEKGVLLIGSTESLLGITDRFERNVYQGAVYYTLKKG